MCLLAKLLNATPPTGLLSKARCDHCDPDGRGLQCLPDVPRRLQDGDCGTPWGTGTSMRRLQTLPSPRSHPLSPLGRCPVSRYHTGQCENV